MTADSGRKPRRGNRPAEDRARTSDNGSRPDDPPEDDVPEKEPEIWDKVKILLWKTARAKREFDHAREQGEPDEVLGPLADKAIALYNEWYAGTKGLDHDSLVTAKSAHKRADRDANRIIANEDWKPPDGGVSLAAEKKAPPAPVSHVVDGLLPEGISILAAQWKAGKTTLGINLAACLGYNARDGVTPRDFLDYFSVRSLSGNVGYWNLEVDQPQMFEWQDRLMSERTAGRVFTAHLRGNRIDLFHDATCEWAIEWLRERSVEVWIPDPIGRMLDDENSSSEFNRWFRRLEEIVRMADVKATLLIHHSGHPAPGQSDAVPRTRGASSMMGNPDATLSYRHGGDLGTAPPAGDSLRYLSAFGRGVDVPELTLDYEYGTGRLYALEDAQGRKADKSARHIDNVLDILAQYKDWELNSSALREAVGGGNNDRNAISAAIKSGRIITKRGEDGKSVLHALSDAEKSRRKA